MTRVEAIKVLKTGKWMNEVTAARIGAYYGKEAGDCSKAIAMAIDALQAEEDGLTLRLPCKVGTVVYGISTPCGGCEILTAALDKDITLETALNSTCKTCPDATVEEIKFDVDLLAEWGEWVFATREEAEAALKGGKQ